MGDETYKCYFVKVTPHCRQGDEPCFYKEVLDDSQDQREDVAEDCHQQFSWNHGYTGCTVVAVDTVPRDWLQEQVEQAEATIARLKRRVTDYHLLLDFAEPPWGDELSCAWEGDFEDGTEGDE